MTIGPSAPSPWPSVVNKVLLAHPPRDHHGRLCAATAELASGTESGWPSQAGMLTACPFAGKVCQPLE